MYEPFITAERRGGTDADVCCCLDSKHSGVADMMKGKIQGASNHQLLEQINPVLTYQLAYFSKLGLPDSEAQSLHHVRPLLPFQRITSNLSFITWYSIITLHTVSRFEDS